MGAFIVLELTSHCVESGASALELVATESFDLVLLDLMMPGLSGFEILCRLKTDDGTGTSRSS